MTMTVEKIVALRLNGDRISSTARLRLGQRESPGLQKAVDLSASENSSERKRVCRSTHLTDSCRC